MKSIRGYLLSRLLGGSALVLLCAAAATYLLVTRSLEAQFDRNLSDRVQALASILFQVEDEVEFEFSDELMPEYDETRTPSYFELRFEDGRLLERSNSLRGKDLSVTRAASSEPTHWTAALPDGRVGRFVAQLVEVHHVYPEEGPDRPQAARVVVAVARGREDLTAAQRALLARCAAGTLGVLGLIAVVAWAAVRRGLAPARRLAGALDAIDVERVPDRLDAGELPRELVPVARTTDALLLRVSRALERERRTAADIAHELRTPISELMTVAEVELRNGRDPAGAHRALETVREVAWRMGRSVSTLLQLARLEMGADRLEPADVDLGALVRELLRSLGSVARERDLRVDAGIAPGEIASCDPDVLRIIVSNVLGNALCHAIPGSAVACRSEQGNGRVHLVIENATNTLGPEDLRALAEPFWRKEHARSDGEHSGLGLALSRALAERAGLTLSFGLEGSTFRAEIAMPSSARSARGTDAQRGSGGA